MKRALDVLRWVALLPAAVLGTWAAWLVVTVLNRLTGFMFTMDPDSLISRIYLETVSGLALGGMFVYAGVIVAPVHRRGLHLLSAQSGSL